MDRGSEKTIFDVRSSKRAPRFLSFLSRRLSYEDFRDLTPGASVAAPATQAE
jgi:hypothetical protein